MVKCPQCGFSANEDVKFCDRCGQGLARAAAAPLPLPPLKPGTILKHGLQVVELIGASSVENRYRVTPAQEGKAESFQLRERAGPVPEAVDSTATDEASSGLSSAPVAIKPAEDPNGPRAKTQELKLPPPAPRDSLSMQEPESATTEAVSRSPKPDGSGDESPPVLAGAAEHSVEDGRPQSAEDSQTEPAATANEASAAEETSAKTAALEQSADDLGDVFGRVLGLSLTLKHPAFSRALWGFAQDGRVYLVYADETLTPLSKRPGGIKMREHEAIGVAIQICQAVGFAHRRALRVNDICPHSVAFSADGRVELTGLDYVSNDTELQSEPIFNDGYTAPEIYKGKKVDKRADVFSIGALLYTCLTGERIAAESWREEADSVSFYPPHVVSPALEQAIRRALAFNPADRWPSVDALKGELVKLNGVIRIRAAAMTDVGMVRELNEDSVMAVEYLRQSQVEPSERFLYLVADGMGGAAAGEVASAIAVSTVRDYVESRVSTEEAKDLCELLKSALEEANRGILAHQAANPDLRGMGSTAVSALIVPPDAAVAWVGDSRAYLAEGSDIRQITKDHSLVQRLIEIGQLTTEQARHHEHKNVITRSLGARQSGPAGAEAVAVRLKRGDRMILCSDGLVAHVEDGRIGEILRRHSDPYETGRELVVAANAGGGTDNISVVVIFAE